jgi:hypothetical protein
MRSVSATPRRLFAGRFYETVMTIASPASNGDDRHSDKCSTCGRAVLPVDPLAPRKGLRRPPNKRVATTFASSEFVCTKCCPNFSSL